MFKYIFSSIKFVSFRINLGSINTSINIDLSDPEAEAHTGIKSNRIQIASSQRKVLITDETDTGRGPASTEIAHIMIQIDQ